MTAGELQVSVIVPTYNRAAYLQEALASIAQQNLPPAEVIVVDDGSTDNTAEVALAAGVLVRLVRQEHQGVAAARNLGLQLARGDLIAWLDSDDLWEPDFLAMIVPLLARDGRLDGAYSGFALIDASGAPLGHSVQVVPPDALYDTLVRDCILTTPSLVVRKACYDQVGGFDPQFRVSEDYDMWLRLAKRYRIIAVPHPLVRIRIHTTNTMADVDALCRARLALTRKHFGALDDGAKLSPDTAVAYGYAFRSIGRKYMECGRDAEGWRYLQQAVAVHPQILERLDTFYELALGDQPRAHRGEASRLDISARAKEMLGGLDALFRSANPAVQARRGAAFGNAYLALAMLNDQAGDWHAARRDLLASLRHNPKLFSWSWLRRLIKVTMGPSAVRRIRSMRAVRANRQTGATQR